YGSLGGEVVLIVLSIVVGMALMAQWLIGVIERTTAEPTPWQQLGPGAEGEPDAAAEEPAHRTVPRSVGAVVGAGLLLFAAFDVLAFGQVQDSFGLTGLRGFVVGVVAFVSLVVLIAGPLVLAAQAGARRDRKQRDRARERQAVAAHLHDSVLQTLALIQRSAADPDRVVTLARQGERGLRAWLAGRDETGAVSLAEAVERVVAEVEAERGVLVDCVIGGEAPMNPRTAELVAATREALRNAARHGGGVDVRLFLDVDSGGATVFVRDGGAGFDPSTVPAERGGIRDAMIGRMERVGGTTTIDSDDGGTEVVLRLPREVGGGA
ncbi:MAG: ATP-binding protein, partial [Solirubrobacteraceae bacterium]|nr:ATP-binding protein [Solirubrobacteraceae bacterium]